MAEEPNPNSNPLANLDEETQRKIQELQMLEQGFQQLLMQKNAFSMESNETDLIIKEVEKHLEKSPESSEIKWSLNLQKKTFLRI